MKWESCFRTCKQSKGSVAGSFENLATVWHLLHTKKRDNLSLAGNVSSSFRFDISGERTVMKRGDKEMGFLTDMFGYHLNFINSISC